MRKVQVRCSENKRMGPSPYTVAGGKWPAAPKPRPSRTRARVSLSLFRPASAFLRSMSALRLTLSLRRLSSSSLVPHLWFSALRLPCEPIPAPPLPLSPAIRGIRAYVHGCGHVPTHDAPQLARTWCIRTALHRVPCGECRSVRIRMHLSSEFQFGYHTRDQVGKLGERKREKLSAPRNKVEEFLFESFNCRRSFPRFCYFIFNYRILHKFHLFLLSSSFQI